MRWGGTYRGGSEARGSVCWEVLEELVVAPEGRRKVCVAPFVLRGLSTYSQSSFNALNCDGKAAPRDARALEGLGKQFSDSGFEHHSPFRRSVARRHLRGGRVGGGGRCESRRGHGVSSPGRRSGVAGGVWSSGRVGWSSSAASEEYGEGE